MTRVRMAFLSQFALQYIVHLYYAIIFEKVPGNASHHAATFETFVGGGCWFVSKRFDVKQFLSAFY